MEKNGKWQLALWLISGLFGTIVLTGFYFLGNNVIANDKGSRERDEKIVEKVSFQYAEVIQRLSRIEAKIK